MSPLLSDCTIVEQHAVIHFLLLEEVKPSGICTGMLLQ